EACTRSSSRVHRVNEAAWHDDLQLPAWATAIELRERRMVKTRRDRKIFGVVPLDRLKERCEERWIAIRRILQIDQQSHTAATPVQHLIQGRHQGARVTPLEPTSGIQLPNLRKRQS